MAGLTTMIALPPPHVIVVSYLAKAPFSPRGIRTRELLEALARECSIELIDGPSDSSSRSGPRLGRSPLKRVLHFVHSSFLLDKFEIWSRRRFRSWQPQATGALLVGFPFSPLVYASRRLAAAGIPYVLDVGDPWILTKAGGRPANRYVALLRARRAEQRLWAGAAGSVVTTHSQASALQSRFPELPILIRPNGFTPIEQGALPAESRVDSRRPDSILRLVHFGDIYVARLAIGDFLAHLGRSGMWNRVEFHQYGSDWTGELRAQRDIEVFFHEPRPWPEIVASAGTYDLALVVGNRDPSALPSKAVSYLQLPIPRLAVVEDERNAALAQYVADKPGWMVLRVDRPDVSDMIESHLSRNWTFAELAPPASEQWENVSSAITQFVLRVLAC